MLCREWGMQEAAEFAEGQWGKRVVKVPSCDCALFFVKFATYGRDKTK